MRAHLSYSTCFNMVFSLFGFGGAIVGCVLLYKGCVSQ
jgi:hypothetical protein